MTEQEAEQLATHRHYKGGLYRYIGVARHSETEEAVVVYEHLWPHARGLWVRRKRCSTRICPTARRAFASCATDRPTDTPG